MLTIPTQKAGTDTSVFHHTHAKRNAIPNNVQPLDTIKNSRLICIQDIYSTFTHKEIRKCSPSAKSLSVTLHTKANNGRNIKLLFNTTQVHIVICYAKSIVWIFLRLLCYVVIGILWRPAGAFPLLCVKQSVLRFCAQQASQVQQLVYDYQNATMETSEHDDSPSPTIANHVDGSLDFNFDSDEQL